MDLVGFNLNNLKSILIMAKVLDGKNFRNQILSKILDGLVPFYRKFMH